jgi:hypothetical protein
MRRKVVAFAMRGGCGLMGMCGLIVKLSGSIVCTLRHCYLS